MRLRVATYLRTEWAAYWRMQDGTVRRTTMTRDAYWTLYDQGAGEPPGRPHRNAVWLGTVPKEEGGRAAAEEHIYDTAFEEGVIRRAPLSNADHTVFGPDLSHWRLELDAEGTRDRITNEEAGADPTTDCQVTRERYTITGGELTLR